MLKPVFRIVFAVFVALCFALVARSQSSTNVGTEFWTAYMDHNNGAADDGTGKDGGSLMSLYVTSAYNTAGKVTINDGSFAPINFTVKANQVTIVTIPPRAFLDSISGISNKGLHIVTSKPVSIYAHIYALAVSGATLLLPASTLGQDYLSINYTQRSNSNKNSFSAFIVIATQDNTAVKVTPAAKLIDGHAAGATFTVNLNKGQLYQGLSPVDLSDTRITAVNASTGNCAPVAVFSGSSRIDIGCDNKNNTSDNLFQQVYPTGSWGKNYVTVPLSGRSYDVFRIFLSDPAAVNPNVTVDNVPVPLSGFKNGYYEFHATQPKVISSDLPIQVVQYAVSANQGPNCTTLSSDLGDPEMIFLNPTEQTINHATLYSTGNYQILQSYINVVMKTASVSSFMLDGLPYTSFKPVPVNPAYSYAQIPVASGPNDVQVSSGPAGTHSLSAADGFNAIAYGWGTNESYGYAAGTNLQNLSKYIVLANPADINKTQPNGCIGTTYKLQLSLPYQTPKIQWNLENGTIYTDNNPIPVGTTVNGTQTLYRYQYPNPVTYNTTGDTLVIATAFNPNSGPCGNNDEIPFGFNISGFPVADFALTDQCAGDSTSFKDKTNADSTVIKSWAWDFGDGGISALQNPKHLFKGPGNYKVGLTVANVNGCTASTSQVVHINKLPTAAFLPGPSCIGQTVTFTDQSTSVDGKIVQWIWNYGDGITDTYNTNKQATHTYNNPGSDTVKLTVITDGGCSNTVSQVLNINPLPVVDFSLPAICQADSYAQFNDLSTIADYTQQGFTYVWDFGDPNATAADNTSTLQNPTHKYSKQGNYKVTLTVTSKYGCPATVTKALTVNGDVPVASFSVENSNKLCSANDVVFDDQSTVDFGNVTKVVWYFDLNNSQTDTAIFYTSTLPADRKVRHNYGQFNSAASRSYLVRMDVYSGITCVNTAMQNITVYASPVASISQVGPFCLGVPPVQIVANNNGLNAGVFSGSGVSPTGLFNPSKSGPGVFTITYTMGTQSGCSFTTSEQITVNPQPHVSLPAAIDMLLGDQVPLPAQASGDSLTYKWTPSTGLDHDDVLNPLASPAENTTYQLLITNPGGCQAVSQITVTVLKSAFIPSAFTPNGDGVNDTWNVNFLSGYPHCTVDIYSRYGQKVYTSIGYNIPWDGAYHGASLPPGAYYYIIDPKDGRRQMTGSVAIIR